MASTLSGVVGQIADVNETSKYFVFGGKMLNVIVLEPYVYINTFITFQHGFYIILNASNVTVYV